MMGEFEHWNGKTLEDLHWAISVLASDFEAFNDANRKAILQVTALTLGRLVKELNWEP